jgi:hypothetical protein
MFLLRGSTVYICFFTLSIIYFSSSLIEYLFAASFGFVLDCLQRLRVGARKVFNSMKIPWKFENNLLRNYLMDNLTKINQSYNLKNGTEYALTYYLKSCSRKSFFY